MTGGTPRPKLPVPLLRRSLSSCSSCSDGIHDDTRSPKCALTRRLTGDSVTGDLQINFGRITPQAFRFSPLDERFTPQDTPQLALTRLESEFSSFHLVGKGSFSDVFRATHKLDGSEYALKRSRICENSKREIAILAKLAKISYRSFGNFIVKYFTSWVEEGCCIMQMELCDESLGERWRRSRPLPEQVCRKVAVDVCRGLKFLHANGVVHLDVKPDNIVFADAEGIYKLADFGLAHELQASSGVTEVTSGDARYLPREVLRGETAYLKKVDIFAMGATLLEVSSCEELPSNGPRWHAIRDGKACKPGVSSRWGKVIDMLMNADPQKRPDADQVLRQIHF